MKRSVIAVIFLTLLTCGIYWLYWMCVFKNELKMYLQDDSIAPGLWLLLSILCFPFFYFWMFKTGQEIARSREKAGLDPRDQSVLYLVLSIFGLGIVSMALMQDQMNDVWDKQAQNH